MLRLLCGEDTFSLREALDHLRESLDADGSLPDNTLRLDGREVAPAELESHCRVLPFFGQRRMVIVSGLLGRFERESAAVEPWVFLRELGTGLPDSVVVVLVEGALRASNPLLRTLEGVVVVQRFDPISQRHEQEAWVRARAERLGLEMEAAATRRLLDVVERPDLWRLQSELEKLASYAPDRAVTAADVDLLVAGESEPHIADLVHAVAQGDRRRALAQADAVLRAGQPLQLIIGWLAGEYRRLLLAGQLAREGVPAPQAAARIGVRSEAAARALMARAQRVPPERAERALELVLEADGSVKRGERDEETALALLVARLAGAARR